MTLRHTTIVGAGDPESTGVLAQAAGAGNKATVRVANSIVDGVGHALSRHAVTGARASLVADWSSWAPGGVVSENPTGGTGALIAGERVAGAPLFAAPGAGDFRLHVGSPLVDAEVHRASHRLAIPITAVLLVPPAAPAAAGPKTVELGDNYMIEDAGVPTLTLEAGTKVKFVWTGRRRHNVTAGNPVPGAFASPTQRNGTWSHRFKRKGTFDLICTIHGAGDKGMKTVVR